MKVGPVEVMVCAFPRPEVDSAVINALAEVVKPGAVSIIDLVLLSRDRHGVVHVRDLDDHLPEACSGLTGPRLLTLLSDGDLDIAAESLGNNETALVLALEHRWEQHLSDAVQASGGVIYLIRENPQETVVAAVEAGCRADASSS
jgi:Family of unknown function (DUF6325)